MDIPNNNQKLGEMLIGLKSSNCVTHFEGWRNLPILAGQWLIVVILFSTNQKFKRLRQLIKLILADNKKSP